ncbi:hypothetical protein MHK_004353 [Candidatus Magnetomorum sp. HK-1]|nr:hypothetical protein MHK_004353 [Candidatus Magnetomorum sp. HK-1]
MNFEIIDPILSPFRSIIYRYNATRNKNFSINQVLQVTYNFKVCYQIFNNFTELYGSRWKAIQKINQIYDVKCEK